MKILLVTSHFYPESFKANDMAFELARRGHEVTVLTPIPDYPQGHFYKGYGLFKRRKEMVKGVNVIRSIVIPRHDGSAKWIAANYLSYTWFSIIKALRLGLTKKYDAVVVHETSPVMVGIPAVIVKKMQRIKSHFWVLDLWPESLEAAGGIHNKFILGAFRKLTKWIYRNSDTILIGSKGFRQSINKMGDFDNKIKYFPNWVDRVSLPSSPDNYFTFPKGFNVVFTGNIGEAQDMEHILECAQRLQGKGINFILVGKGRKLDFVRHFVKRNRLDNVFLPGSFPRNAMPFFYENADVLFLSLKKSDIFSLTVPAKLQAYMTSGKPVVAMMDGEGAALIKEADCGWAVDAEDVESLTNLLLELSDTDKSILQKKGMNGKIFSDSNYNFIKCIDNLEDCLYS